MGIGGDEGGISQGITAESENHGGVRSLKAGGDDKVPTVYTTHFSD